MDRGQLSLLRAALASVSMSTDVEVLEDGLRWDVTGRCSDHASHCRVTAYEDEAAPKWGTIFRNQRFALAVVDPYNDDSHLREALGKYVWPAAPDVFDTLWPAGQIWELLGGVQLPVLRWLRPGDRVVKVLGVRPRAGGWFWGQSGVVAVPELAPEAAQQLWDAAEGEWANGSLRLHFVSTQSQPEWSKWAPMGRHGRVLDHSIRPKEGEAPDVALQPAFAHYGSFLWFLALDPGDVVCHPDHGELELPDPGKTGWWVAHHPIPDDRGTD